MKRVIKGLAKSITLVLLFSTLLTFSCTKEGGEKIQTSVSPTELTLNNVENKLSFKITTVEEWSITNIPSWCKVTPTSGKGDATVSVEVSAYSGDDREVNLVISTGHKVKVIQSADYVTLSKRVFIFKTTGEAETIDLKSNTSWKFEQNESNDWCTISPASGSGDTKVTLTPKAFETREDRETVAIKLTYGNKEDEIRVEQDMPNASIEKAVLLAPANNSINQSLTPIFSWKEVVDPEGDEIEYTVEYSTNSNFVAYTTLESTTLLNKSTSSILEKDMVYYWRVIAKDAFGEKSMSEVSQFRTGLKGEIIANGSFEGAIDFNSSSEGWTIKGGQTGLTTENVSYSVGTGYNGSNCIKLYSSSKADVRAAIKLKNLKPETPYRIHAKVKTVDVSSTDGGANLSVVGKWHFSDFITGTNDWKNIHIDIVPNEDGEITIACGLGFWNEFMASGTAYFDDVFAIENPDEIQYSVSDYISLYVPREFSTISDSEFGEMVNMLNDVCKSYADFYGKGPAYGGGPALGGVNANAAIAMSNDIPAWAWAGDPIVFREDAVAAFCDNYKNRGTIEFGLIHEMGHTYAPGAGLYGNQAWVWDEEMRANFTMSYGLFATGYGVYMRGKEYYGREIIDYYKIAYDDMMKDEFVYNDGIHYMLLRIADKYGWDVYRYGLRDLYKSSQNSFTDNYAKFCFFVNTCSKYAKDSNGNTVDLLETEFSEKELANIKNGIN